MGNRAVITSKENFENNGIGIYLHWNGGYDSVNAFLKYCELKGYGTPNKDNCGWARLCQVIGNFFGGSCSISIDTVNNLDCDNWDNGVYIIEDWKIVDRKFFNGAEQMNYELEEMLLDIDSCMPVEEQIGEYLKAKEIPVAELKIGDTIIMLDYNNKMLKADIIGFGEDCYVNETNVNGLPYVDLYGDCYSKNINNYIHTETVKIMK